MKSSLGGEKAITWIGETVHTVIAAQQQCIGSGKFTISSTLEVVTRRVASGADNKDM